MSFLKAFYNDYMITSIDTVTQVSIMFRKNRKENKKMDIHIEQNTRKYI